jgi:hypothetical protein
VFVGCGGAVFQGEDDDDSGGQGAVGSGGTSGKGGSSGSGGKGGGSGSGGSAGKGAGGSGGGGATGGSAGRGGSGAGGSLGGSAGSGNTGNEGGTAGMGAAGGSGGSGNTGNEGGTGGSSGSSGMGGSSGGTNTEQWAHDYEQSCDFDDNCSLVQQGDKCACPTCNTGAVSSSVAEQYQSDWEMIMCPPGEPVCPEVACAEQLATCTESGKCYARPPLYIDGANYPTTCEQPSDCHAIFTGEVCSSCQCAIAAVNRDGYDQYREDVESVDCSPGPSVCDCAPQGEVTCLIDVMAGGTGQCVVTNIGPLPE